VVEGERISNIHVRLQNVNADSPYW
jgi:hypothetical protein